MVAIYVELALKPKEALNPDRVLNENPPILRAPVDKIHLHPVDGKLQIEKVDRSRNTASYQEILALMISSSGSTNSSRAIKVNQAVHRYSL